MCSACCRCGRWREFGTPVCTNLACSGVTCWCLQHSKYFPLRLSTGFWLGNSNAVQKTASFMLPRGLVFASVEMADATPTTVDPAAASESARLHAIKHRGEFVRLGFVPSSLLRHNGLRTPQEYPIQVWYFTLSCLCLATIINITTIFWAKLAVRWGRNNVSPEGGTSRGFLSRISAATLTTWRIVAFRWRIPLGRTFGMSLFEVFVTAIYLAALLIWEFVHSTHFLFCSV